jgi:delta8-fatty-acid desaturase
MSRYQIGIILEPWVDMEPPISTESARDVNSPEKVFKLSEKGVYTRLTSNGQPTTHPGTGSKIYGKETTAFTSFTDIAEQEDVDRALRDYPSIDPITQRGITQKFRKLHAKIREKGLYKCDYWNYGYDFLRYAVLFSLFLYAYNARYFLTAALFLGCFWQQIMFVAHDAGHLGITHNVVFDTIAGILVADLCCGLSIGWWKSSHNVHHLVPNHPVSRK